MKSEELKIMWDEGRRSVYVEVPIPESFEEFRSWCESDEIADEFVVDALRLAVMVRLHALASRNALPRRVAGVRVVERPLPASAERSHITTLKLLDEEGSLLWPKED